MWTHSARWVPAHPTYGSEGWCSEVRWCLAERLRSARAGAGRSSFERGCVDSASIVSVAWIYLLCCVSCVDLPRATSKVLSRNLYRDLGDGGNGCIEQTVLRLPGQVKSEGLFDTHVRRKRSRLSLGFLCESRQLFRPVFAFVSSLSRALPDVVSVMCRWCQDRGGRAG